MPRYEFSEGDAAVDAVEVVDRQRDADLVRHRGQVEQRVRRPADRRVNGDRVLERLAGEDQHGG